MWFTSVSDYVQLRDELESEFPGRFEFVRADHFMMLLNESYNKPYAVALQKSATASDNAAQAAAAFDGSFTTGWQSTAGAGASLTVDLGASYSIGRYVLKNAETAYMASSLNTAAWQLQASSDGVEWTTVDTVSGNGEDIVYRSPHDFKARYVRLVIDDPGADGIARVQELELYGTALEDASFLNSVKEGVRDAWTMFVNMFFNIFYKIYNWFGSLHLLG